MLLVPAFLALFLLVRGAPVFLYRDDLAPKERVPFALVAAVARLSLVVVITSPESAAPLAGATVLSVLLFPTIAGVLLSRGARTAPRATR